MPNLDRCQVQARAHALRQGGPDPLPDTLSDSPIMIATVLDRDGGVGPDCIAVSSRPASQHGDGPQSTARLGQLADTDGLRRQSESILRTTIIRGPHGPERKWSRSEFENPDVLICIRGLVPVILVFCLDFLLQPRPPVTPSTLSWKHIHSLIWLLQYTKRNLEL